MSYTGPEPWETLHKSETEILQTGWTPKECHTDFHRCAEIGLMNSTYLIWFRFILLTSCSIYDGVLEKKIAPFAGFGVRAGTGSQKSPSMAGRRRLWAVMVMGAHMRPQIHPGNGQSNADDLHWFTKKSHQTTSKWFDLCVSSPKTDEKFFQSLQLLVWCSTLDGRPC